MPRKSSGPKLWFDKSRDQWTIVDGKRKQRTGCGEAARGDAEKALEAYIGSKHAPASTPTPPVADVLAVYVREHGPTVSDGGYIIGCRFRNLIGWWGTAEGRLQLSDVTKINCNEYVKHRERENMRKAVETEIRLARRDKREPDIEAAEMDAPAGTTGAREDLVVLRAAINYYHANKKTLQYKPEVSLPQKPEARDAWMTRQQLASFLWRSRRVVHDIAPEGSNSRKLVRHLSRFIILGYYTGSRSGVVLGTKYSMADYENDFLKRKPYGARQTKKRAPMHKLPARLKFWLRHWQRIDGKVSEYVVHIHGKPVTKLRRSWITTREEAGLSDEITPHSLRHSRATHLMRNRKVDKKDAAEFLGMTLQTFIDTYAHHDPEWQKDAADAR